MSLRRSSRVAAVRPATNVVQLPTSSSSSSNRIRKSSDSKIKKAGHGPKPPKSTDTSKTAAAQPNADSTTPDLPSTPKRRRKDASASNPPPPITPTPTQVGIMTTSYSTGDIDDVTPPPFLADRPAEPHQTNAPLKTPGGSRLLTYAEEVIDSSPSKTGVPRPTTTTGHLLEEACAHLIKVEPRLKPVIAKHHCRIFSPAGLAEEVDPFRSLSSGIMAQQISGAAANSIKNKFVGLFNPPPVDGDESSQRAVTFPGPAQVAACDVSFLRQAGLSGRKAEYIKGLAEKFVSGELSAQMLIRASDDEVLEKLTAVRGLGKWSVEMFACFGLKRMDVFSTGDLGVQRGMAALMGRDVAKLKAKGGGKWKYMSEQDMLEHSAKFAPYRSLLMWYMWRIEDVNVDAVQDN